MTRHIPVASASLAGNEEDIHSGKYVERFEGTLADFCQSMHLSKVIKLSHTINIPMCK